MVKNSFFCHAYMKFITRPTFRGPIFREDGNQAGVTLLRHAVNGWQVMLLAACAAKCEVKSRLPESWKESSVSSADQRIPAGPRTLAPMTRELWLRGHRRNSLTSQRLQAALCAPPNIRGRTTHCPSNGDNTWRFFFFIFCEKPLVLPTHPARRRLTRLCPCLRACLMAVTWSLLQQRSDCSSSATPW